MAITGGTIDGVTLDGGTLMTDTLRIKRRALGGAAGPPGSLAVGELAYNEQDGGLYIGRSNSSVVQVNPTSSGPTGQPDLRTAGCWC